jgi:hypothetical protein|tara:strand:- start:158 stop:358 length:201 start_codon:yes stop_codon:yes gene_type:complete
MDSEENYTSVYKQRLIFKKLQILYTYSQNRLVKKNFKTLLEETSSWDKDCKYALDNQNKFDIIKLL